MSGLFDFEGRTDARIGEYLNGLLPVLAERRQFGRQMSAPWLRLNSRQPRERRAD